MKNILLPTDLTVQSLWPVHNIVKDAGAEKPVIHVVHMLQTPSSMADLFSLKSDKPYRSVPANFTEAFQMLCHKYDGEISKMYFRFIYGGTVRYLRNFLEGNEIDSVYMLTNYDYGHPMPNSVDFIEDLCKCKVELNRLPLHTDALSDYQILSALLHDQRQPAISHRNKAATTSISFS